MPDKPSLSNTSHSSQSNQLNTSFRSNLLQEQAANDGSVLDQSLLGCPLSSLEMATISLVGGKGLQCWKLTKHGFPVPSCYVVPTYVYSLHVDAAQVEDEIRNVFSTDFRRSERQGQHHQVRRQEAQDQLTSIREKLLQTPLTEQVKRNLDAFLHSFPEHTSFAVRSSATAEDLANQSFAGQYDTFLYQQTKEDIYDAIKACWASMFQSHILDYAVHSEENYEPNKLKTPSMAVLVMHMVEAKASGVLFSENLWGDRNEVMVEAVLGQGEGLVSGEIIPDRYVLHKQSLQVRYKQINTNKTHQFVKATDNQQDGVKKVEINTPPQDLEILSRSQLQFLAKLARSVEEFENRPQDIEWALDRTTGKIYLLQSRPITTKGPKSLAFLPPGKQKGNIVQCFLCVCACVTRKYVAHWIGYFCSSLFFSFVVPLQGKGTGKF